MGSKRNRIAMIAFALLCCSCLVAWAADAKPRYALVIGNGAYQTMSRLANPVNDAIDVAAALTGYGFTVDLVTNASLGDMAGAVQRFVESVSRSGAEVALFYYAGHGVQFNGANYLVPVNADIRASYELLDKTMGMDSVVRGLEQAGSGFNLIVLDACRDNPFSSTRGGDRGLSVMGTGGRGSMVVFATSPGDVAQDGTGRNSPFTTAFLESISTPGIEIRQLVTNVQRKVQEQTGGKQVPWVNMSFTGEFYFQTVEQQLAKSQSALTGLQTDLAALEKEIAARESAIKNTLNSDERRRLEADQARAKAMEAAKQLELQRAAETQRQAEEILASQAAQDSLRKEMAARLSSQQASLAKQAEERKVELEKLRVQQQTTTQSLMDRLETIARLKSVIQDIETRYLQSIDMAMADLAMLQKQRVDAFIAENPRDPWETSSEYEKRLGVDLSRLGAEYTIEKDKQRNALQVRMEQEVAPVKEQIVFARQELQGMRFIVEPQEVSVRVSPFDVEQKRFPISMMVSDDAVSFTLPLFYTITSRDRDVLRNEYYRVYSADQSGALMGRISYRAFEVEEGLWMVVVETAEVVNLLENDAVLSSAWEKSTIRVVDPVGWFKISTSVERTTPTQIPKNLVLSGLVSDSTLYFAGASVVATQSSVYLAKVANPSSFRVTIESPWMMQPVVLNRSLSVTARQLIWCDVQNMIAPAGQLRIPRSDLTIEARDASNDKLVVMESDRLGSVVKLPPGSYKVMAKLPDDRYFAFEDTVVVKASEQTLVDPGKIGLSTLYRYEQTSLELSKLQSALDGKLPMKLKGWNAIETGALGLVSGAVSYLLYTSALRLYEDSILTEDLQRYRREATMWSTMFTASMAVGVAGVTTGGVILATTLPTIKRLSDQIKEKVNQLGELDAEISAAKARKAMDAVLAGGFLK